jgi:succinoglycan biosynthesis protein ExoO
MTKASVPENSVTVLIAAFNAEHFLRRAVLSALDQTAYVSEVLIVDDASTDGTASEAKRLAEHDPRVRLIQLDVNSGPAAARNRGFGHANGAWIAVLDADDAFRPDRVRQMVEAGVTHFADIVIDSLCYFAPATNHTGSSILAESGGTGLVSLDEYVEHARPFRKDVDWGLLKPIFRSSFIREGGLLYPEHSRHGEDFLLMVEALAKGGRLVLLRRAGYLYTGRDAGLSRTSLDYGTMCRHTRNLMADPRFAQNKRLQRAFSARLRALDRLILLREFQSLRRDRAYVAMLSRIVSDHAFRTMIGFVLLRRLHLV